MTYARMLLYCALAGIQAQTAECLVVGEITAKDLVVALNKVGVVLQPVMRMPGCAACIR